jgi:hypothetical protein
LGRWGTSSREGQDIPGRLIGSQSKYSCFAGNNLRSSLTGVYGLITAFSIPGPLYLVKSAEATLKPLTWSPSGSAKRNFLVLWLTSSTLWSFRLMKPWSPPVKALAAAAPIALFALSSALFAASLSCCVLPPWLKK